MVERTDSSPQGGVEQVDWLTGLMYYSVLLCAMFGYLVVMLELHTTKLQLGQFSVNPPRLLLEVGGTST